MRSYIDAGNDIITVLDTATALKHGNGLQNAKAPVLKKMQTKQILTVKRYQNVWSHLYIDVKYIFVLT